VIIGTSAGSIEVQLSDTATRTRSGDNALLPKRAF
jgi:hypothetical protein